MLISDDKQFIFVHIEKTAGTSITSALQAHSIQFPTSKWASLQRNFGYPKDYRRFKFPMHCPLVTAQQQMPKERFDAYYKFAFVRNPWDRLVSEYNASIKKNRRARHRKIKAMANFGEYINYEIKRDKLHQHRMLLDQNGDIAVDKVGYFENLVDDYTAICTHLGLNNHLSKLNAFSHADYRSFYNDNTRQKVADHWATDISAFNYQF